MLLIPESPEFKQLMLQIGDDLMAMARLRGLLAENDEAQLQRELRLMRKQSSEKSVLGHANDTKSTCKGRLRKR
jgi:hypothetical protein